MSINNVVAFEDWNSSNRAWNTGTWNGDVTFDLTSTASLGTLIGGVEGDAAVTLTGFGTTASLGSFFTTNESFKMVAVVGSGVIDTTQSCQVFPTGVSATGEIGEGTGEIFATWGQIIPIQTPSYSAITPSQSPSFSAVSPSQSPSWTDLAA